MAPDGQPLTPARPERVRHLLDTNRARARWLEGRVFAIQLLSEPSGREIAALTLGIDDGAKHVGLSVVMMRRKRPPQEVVSLEVRLPQGIKERMDRRRGYRRLRRYRLGYRKERFLNRPTGTCQICGRNPKAGKDHCRHHGDRNLRPEREKCVPNFAPWLPPSQRARKDGIARTVKALLRFLPLSAVTVEAGEFDFGLLGRPWEYKFINPLGHRYQQASTLAALVAAYGKKCCYCGQEGRKGDPLTVDHWQPRARGGTDRWENLVAAHLTCNQAKGDRTPAEAGLNPVYEPREIGDTSLVKWASRTQQGKRYLARKLVDLGLRYKGLLHGVCAQGAGRGEESPGGRAGDRGVGVPGLPGPQPAFQALAAGPQGARADHAGDRVSRGVEDCGRPRPLWRDVLPSAGDGWHASRPFGADAGGHQGKERSGGAGGLDEGRRRAPDRGEPGHRS